MPLRSKVLSAYTRLSSFLAHKAVRRWYLRWVTAKAMGRTPFVPLPGGGRGYATSRFNDFYGIAIQHPDEAELRSFAALLGAGGLYVDVGANMGLTCVVAAKTGRTARILAFEPTHVYAAAWHHNMVVNRVLNATLFQCAVGESPGTIDFIVNPNAPMHNRVHVGVAHARYETLGTTATHLESVPITALDTLCDSIGVNDIQLLKIDVEGAEPAVLRGAKRLLERRAIKAIYCEFIPEFMTEMGEDVASHVRWMQALGYPAHRIEHDGSIGAALPAEDLIARKFHGLNVAFITR